MQFWIDLVGWVGSAAVVLAYALISTHKIKANSHLYQYLNIFGSVGLIINTLYYNALPSATVNVIWVIIGVGSLVYSKIHKQKAGL
ncbi:MAG: hypothetical protein EAZ55_10745 [Cytophagales bacterium]|nr:MAG: hypothetical protein EAZ55_10745 [Cytophagales bacterium]